MLLQMNQIGGLAAALSGRVPNTRRVDAGPGLIGGGELTGNIVIGLDGFALSLQSINTYGFIARDANNLPVGRTFYGTTGRVNVTNGNGGAGNPTVDLVETTISPGGVFNRITVDAFGRVMAGSLEPYTVDGGFQGTLNNAALRYINMGTSLPSFGATPAGSRVVLSTAPSNAFADLAIGVASNGIWIGLAEATDASRLRIFAGITEVASISGAGNMIVTGNLAAGTKSFRIPHPSKPDMLLQHGCLEGPEHAVYARGKVTGRVDGAGIMLVDLPDYWPDLVDSKTITLHLTSMDGGNYWIEDITPKHFTVVSDVAPLDRAAFFWLAYATRKDTANLIVELPDDAPYK